MAIATAFTTVNAQDYSQPYTRPSIYTVLVKSDEENSRLDWELENPNLALQRFGLVSNESKIDGTSIRSNVPQSVFPTIPIPQQFFDHNLDVRVIDLDPLTKGLTLDEINAANKAFGIGEVNLKPKKKSGLGAAIEKGTNLIDKAIGTDLGGLVNSVTDLWKTCKDTYDFLKAANGFGNDSTLRMVPAALNKYFSKEHSAELLTAKWFDYNAKRKEKWDNTLVIDRGFFSVTEQEKEKALRNSATTLLGRSDDLISNTFVLAIFLRFRSKAVQSAAWQQVLSAGGETAKAFAKNEGTILGADATSQGLGTLITTAVGKGYVVEVNAFLYKLEWDTEISNAFYDKIFYKNLPFEKLVSLGICKLVPVHNGVTTITKGHRYGLQKKEETEMVKVAIEQSIDEAMAKLETQTKELQTYAPITSMDSKNVVYAKIGTKEGIGNNDEYYIKEAELKDDGHIEYKEVASVKAQKNKIWENRMDASKINELSDKDAKELNINKDAVSLGHTAFKGAKKEDYTGYLLTLKCKNGQKPLDEIIDNTKK